MEEPKVITLNDDLEKWEQNMNEFTKSSDELLNQYEPRFFDEYGQQIKRLNNIYRGFEKLDKDLARLDSQIVKSKEVISSLQEMMPQFNSSDLESKLNKDREILDEIKQIYDFLGFYLELKEENLYTIRFHSLPPERNPDQVFSFDILISGDKFSILNCNPDGCIDPAIIEQQLENTNEDLFLRIILLIRAHLIKNISH